MPIGHPADERGHLVVENNQLFLDRDSGGRWKLEAGLFTFWRARRLVGRRVRVTGSRDGFNLLAVKRLEKL